MENSNRRKVPVPDEVIELSWHANFLFLRRIERGPGDALIVRHVKRSAQNTLCSNIFSRTEAAAGRASMPSSSANMSRAESAIFQTSFRRMPLYHTSAVPSCDSMSCLPFFVSYLAPSLVPISPSLATHSSRCYLLCLPK